MRYYVYLALLSLSIGCSLQSGYVEADAATFRAVVGDYVAAVQSGLAIDTVDSWRDRLVAAGVDSRTLPRVR